jgi:putative sigma-54 modulation protein
LNLEVIGRHTEVTPDIRDYAGKRVDKLLKFFDRIHSLRVIVSVERANHLAEFIAHLVKGDMVVAKAAAVDVYTAIDAAADKLENQLKRYKERLREHRAPGVEEAAAPET